MKNIVENQGIKNDKPVPLSYEQLKQRLDAVVAENVALKKFCKNAAFDADYIAELEMQRGGFTDALNDIKTPATDAALAEVEAKAIDKAIERITSVMKHPEVSQAVNALRMFVDVLEAFKKELREGRV